MAEQVSTPDDEPPPLHGSKLAWLTIFISLATFMEVLDMTIVNVSLPAIAGTLGVSPSEATWTISSYTLAAAIMQPLTGWLGRRFGEVRTFLISTMLFVVFSALCGLATSMPMLVTGRLLQGLVSGPMVPMAQAMLMRNYPPEKRGMAMALWAMVVFVAPILGPVLGGWITDNLSWPWLFYINVPVGLLSVIALWGLLRKRETKRVKVPVDVVGLGLLVIGIGALQFMLDNGNEHDWFDSRMIVTCAVIAVVGITCLIAWELTEKHPVLDLHLFAHRNFRIGVSVICLGFFCFFGIVVLYPLWLQTALGYTASWAGIAVAPVGILGLFLMPFVGRNIGRMNLRVAGSFGFLILSAVMFWLSTLTHEATIGQLILPRLLQGAGLAFFFLPLNQIAFSDVKPHELAGAAGLTSFLRNIAGSMSTAICVWLWTDRIDHHRAVMADRLTDGSAWQEWSQQLATQGITDQPALAYTNAVMTQQAQTLGVNDITYAFGWVLLLLIPLLWLARPPFRAQGSGAAH